MDVIHTEYFRTWPCFCHQMPVKFACTTRHSQSWRTALWNITENHWRRAFTKLQNLFWLRKTGILYINVK